MNQRNSGNLESALTQSALGKKPTELVTVEKKRLVDILTATRASLHDQAHDGAQKKPGRGLYDDVDDLLKEVEATS
jgi:hypothetical protein